jgi:hypothetical protein
MKASPAPEAPPEPEPVAPPAPPSLPAAEVAPPPKAAPQEPPPPEKPAPRQPRMAIIPAGTLITVRLSETLTTKTLEGGYHFKATLDQPVVVSGLVLAERGSPQEGQIVSLDKGGRIKGRASLGIELVQMTTADGQHVDVKTETFVHTARSGGWDDAGKAGAAAGIGAAIGAIAGGGAGAAIGAGAGAAAGAGVVLATRGPEARLPEETRITFRLKEPVTLTEHLP